MTTITENTSNPQVGFLHFIWADNQNRKFVLIALAGALIQLLIFKMLYPFADFFSDSVSYIFAASANLDINIWPIGYSKFLRTFHGFTHSDTAVVCFQYFFFVLSALYFFFTLRFFYQLGKNTSLILFLFLFFNPLVLYISNYINSDPLFAALSLFWFTSLLWVINRPKRYQIITHAVILFLAFTVRHNAMYYPFISAIAFILSQHQVKMKFAAIGLSTLLILVFVYRERESAYEMYGIRQFSPMSGWLLGNNALYMRKHLDVDPAKLPSAASRQLDSVSRKFFAPLPAKALDGYLSNYVANFFIRMPSAPLKKYFYLHYDPADDYEVVADWGKASLVFGEYGSWFIKHYPLQYARYFMLINTKNYLIPPLEKLEEYNLGDYEVSEKVQEWFDYKTPTVKVVSLDAQAYVLYIFPYLFLFINILCIGSLVWLIIKRKSAGMSKKMWYTFICVFAFIVANFCFSVFTTINVMRYQFFPIIITLGFSLLLVEWLDKKEKESAAIKSVPGAAAGVRLANV